MFIKKKNNKETDRQNVNIKQINDFLKENCLEDLIPLVDKASITSLQ